MTETRNPQPGFIHFELSRKILLQVSVALAIIVLISVSSYTFLKSVLSSTQEMSARVDNLSRMQDLQVLLQRLEAAQKGYLITGDEKYLNGFDVWLPKAYTVMQELLIHTEKDSLRASMLALDKNIEGRIGLLQKSVALRKQQGFEAARRFFTTEKGTRASEIVQNLLNDVQDRETIGMKQSINEVREKERISLILVLSESFAAFSLILIAALRINSDMVRVKNLHQALDTTPAPKPRARKRG